jgi:hypothetical protein
MKMMAPVIPITLLSIGIWIISTRSAGSVTRKYTSVTNTQIAIMKIPPNVNSQPFAMIQPRKRKVKMAVPNAKIHVKVRSPAMIHVSVGDSKHTDSVKHSKSESEKYATAKEIT